MIFDNIRKISTILVTSAMVILPAVTASNAGGNGSGPPHIDIDGGHLLSVCVLHGGTIYKTASGGLVCKNPKDGRTTTCETNRPSTDDCWTEGRPTGGKPGKPVLSNGGGTMVMPPDTNTTVGSDVKPINGEIIIRK